MCASGETLIWIVLAGYAFGGSFNLEAVPGGDLGFANYSEAGQLAPAAPVAPRAPAMGLSQLPDIQVLGEPEVVVASSRNTAVELVTAFAGAQLQNPLLTQPTARSTKSMSSDTLATIVRNVRREVYSDSRLAYMRRAVGDRELTTEQLGTLLGLLTFSDDRIALVRQIGERVVDAENYPSLFRFFPFETDRETIAAFF